MQPRSLLLGCELVPRSRDLVPGPVYAFGPYFPKSSAKHWDSSWSQMVLDVKHGDAWVTEKTAQIIAGHLNHWLVEPGPYILTYVPSSRHRLEPGAPERLARAICRHVIPSIHLTVAPLLTLARCKRKQQHACFSPEDRAVNVRGCYAFAVWANPHPATILLLDDIVTSGATLRECARVLSTHTRMPVVALAMARTAIR